ncbi:hypothetical protein CPB83DRAFT_156911 [Crepidotus variabilis]|uniref:F-box domain-containing protein n=1 Tax=Crepidotus variabilis TaxID=179855 RepID=A0A9P6EKE2_9AGAR|nr:hypothetical protein CPB83DRAFT_156911 [Crepidotus variabilis]
MPLSIRSLIARFCDPHSSTLEHIQPVLSGSTGPNLECIKVLPCTSHSSKEQGISLPEPRPSAPPPLPEHPVLALEVPHEVEQPAKSGHDPEANLLVPVNHLPVEVLAELFTTICHADSDRFLGDTKNRHRKTTPLVLGSVCKQWRAIVWSTPRIWSHVSLCLSTSRWETQTSLLSDWLSHSGVCPLIINLCFENEEEWASSTPEDFVNILAGTANRWSAINYVLPEDWYPLLEVIKEKLDILTTISTQPLWTDCSLSPSRRKRLKLFEHAPVLECLHLNGYYLTDVSVQWDQLKRFTIQHVYLDECFYALPLTFNLTWCRIYTILLNDVDRMIADPEKPIRLEHLETLIIYSAVWEDLLRLLSHLSLPTLDTLIITAPTQEIVYPELYPVLLKATGCPTELIHIRKFVVGELEWFVQPIGLLEKELREFLALLPLLEDLEIDITSKAEQSTAAFCVWWFIDLLKVPLTDMLHHNCSEQVSIDVEYPTSIQLLEPRSKLKGIDSDRSPELLEEGGNSVTPSSTHIHPHLIPLVPASPLLSSTLLPSYPTTSDPHPDNPPILQNLKHFSFSGPVVFRHGLADAQSQQPDHDTKGRRSESESPIQDVSCSITAKPESEFGKALVQTLRCRRGRSLEDQDQTCSDSSNIESLAVASPWILKPLLSFVFKASALACLEEETRTPTDVVKAELKGMSAAGGLKIQLEDIVWI